MTPQQFRLHTLELMDSVDQALKKFHEATNCIDVQLSIHNYAEEMLGIGTASISAPTLIEIIVKADISALGDSNLSSVYASFDHFTIDESSYQPLASITIKRPAHIWRN